MLNKCFLNSHLTFSNVQRFLKTDHLLSPLLHNELLSTIRNSLKTKGSGPRFHAHLCRFPFLVPITLSLIPNHPHPYSNHSKASSLSNPQYLSPLPHSLWCLALFSWENWNLWFHSFHFNISGSRCSSLVSNNTIFLLFTCILCHTSTGMERVCLLTPLPCLPLQASGGLGLFSPHFHSWPRFTRNCLFHSFP